MRVVDALSVVNSGVSGDLSIEGVLVSGAETWIVDSLDDGPDCERLYLPHEIVQDALLDQVPVSMGGRHLYSEPCTLYGYTSAKRFFPRRAEVDCDGTKYNVSFTGVNAQPHNPADA